MTDAGGDDLVDPGGYLVGPVLGIALARPLFGRYNSEVTLSVRRCPGGDCAAGVVEVEAVCRQTVDSERPAEILQTPERLAEECQDGLSATGGVFGVVIMPFAGVSQADLRAVGGRV